MSDISYTTEEIAALLKVSKLTIYDLIKKGELPAYRVGRQMRIDADDLEAYKASAKQGGRTASSAVQPEPRPLPPAAGVRSLVVCGQDISLDILARHMERSSAYRTLRSSDGSLNGLLSMYHGQADIVSTHLWDGDTGEYNLPYIRRILVGQPYLVIHLLRRQTGFYVRKGNPKQIAGWNDLTRPDVRFVNREKGAGVRVLLDEQLRLHGIQPHAVTGYTHEEANHLGVAGAVARGEADAGLGSEKIAAIMHVDFIPLIEEQYDLVLLKSPENEPLRRLLLDILHSSSFRDELAAIGGYDLSATGTILYETP
ncbi:helix-turn-helix transcriptional regulator [Aneurinibacillus sp. BA2021]|nr:helix-turn-helix transcriptional regulator [Aneurinibacillus sp. BA2021]